MFGLGLDEPVLRRALLAFVVAISLLTVGVSVFG